MDNCIIISDTHAPYHHPDTLAFLKAIKKKYKIKIAKHVGDAVDNHASSFHTIEYDTLSAKDEHEQAKKFIQDLNKIFPKMTMIKGNHGSMTSRKAKEAGIPLDHIKSYNQMYEIKGWKWVDKEMFWIDRSKDKKCLMVHSMGSNTAMNAAKHAFCSVQGHFHSKYGLEYYADEDKIRWSITIGCLIDVHLPAFAYGAGATMNRPIIGCGAIIDDRPVLIPMELDRHGRWDGKV